METTEEPKIFLVGTKRRREVRPVYCVFNHVRFGTLVTQRFFDVEELPRSDAQNWVLVESAESKIEGFRKSDSVANLVLIGPAASADEALKIAQEKFKMKPIPEAGKRRAAK